MLQSYRLPALGLLVLILFIWLSVAVASGRTANFDTVLREDIHRHATAAWTDAMLSFTFIGKPVVLWPLVVLTVYLFLQAGWGYETALLSVCMVGAIALEVGLKHLFHRSRPMPFFNLPEPESYSYPSGHALYALAFFGTLALVLSPHIANRIKRALLWIAAITMLVLIGFSRIYLGVHYPSDVMAGYAVAFVWMAVVVITFRHSRVS